MRKDQRGTLLPRLPHGIRQQGRGDMHQLHPGESLDARVQGTGLHQRFECGQQDRQGRGIGPDDQADGPESRAFRQTHGLRGQQSAAPARAVHMNMKVEHGVPFP